MIPESVLSMASGWKNQPMSNSRLHGGRRGTNAACKKNRREKRQIKILLGRGPPKGAMTGQTHHSWAGAVSDNPFYAMPYVLPGERISPTRKTTMKNRPSITKEEDHKNKEVPDICLGRTAAHYHDELIRCIEQECGPSIPHVHDKPVLSRRSKALAFFLLFILLMTGAIVWHCFANRADRDIYEYQHVPENDLIRSQIAIL